MSTERIQLAAEHIAAEMIDAARQSGTEAVVFVTGNSYMPPIRSYPEAEEIWQSADDSDDIGALMEAVESLLDKASVALDCPEYDNALYVVDLARFEYVEDSAGDSLQDDWRMI